MNQQAAASLATNPHLASGFKLFREGFREVLGILLTQTLSLLVLFVVLFSITMSFYADATLLKLPVDFIVSMVLSVLLMLLVQFGFIASFTNKFWAIAHGQHITSGQAYKLGLKKALPLLIWVVIYLMIVWTGLMLFVVPGILLGTAFFMGAALIIQDHHSILESFKASYQMVWPYLRQTLFYVVVSAGITLGIYFLTIYPLGLFISYITNNNPMLHGILDIGRYALVVLLVPLFVALIIPYYKQLLTLYQEQK